MQFTVPNDDTIYSILHGGRVEVGDAESIEEKWTPGFWMSSVLAAVVAILNSPNLSSPANIDAKKLYDR